jgi:hypothetical protein
MTASSADMASAVAPVFLFSLPRSGSTLTQRVLATHQEIVTASEPWILLPFLYARIPQGVYAAYSHRQATKAIEDFCEGLPGGAEDYLYELRQFTLRLYARRAGSGVRYFLDKTPRYHLVAKEIIQIFPDARFIFLWRNPLAIIASMIETWGRGRWNLYLFEIDLFEGLDRLIQAYARHRDRAYAVKYEELVCSAKPWERMFAYLGLGFDKSQLDSFSGVVLEGRMGDPTGRKTYKSLSVEPLDKWKKALASPARKAWCRYYLRWLGDERLELMGYDRDSLERDLASIPVSYRSMFSDVARMLFGVVFRLIEPLMIRDKLSRLRARKRVYSHF